MEPLMEIILGMVQERYRSQRGFYESVLGITGQSWDRFKKGQRGLSYQSMEKLKTLFTPYEWYLANEVARLYHYLPYEGAFEEFLDLRLQIAINWGLAEDKTVYQVWPTFAKTVPLYRFRTDERILLEFSRALPLVGYRDSVVLRVSESTYHRWMEDPNELYEEWRMSDDYPVL